jgi:hypothetical protein
MQCKGRVGAEAEAKGTDGKNDQWWHALAMKL